MTYVFIRQHNTEDCAAACLTMIAKYHGITISIPKARRITRTDICGTSIFNIVNGASEIGLEATALKGTVAELMDAIHKQQANFPFIAHVRNQQGLDHFVVVYKINGSKVIIADPAVGVLTRSLEQFQDVWTGYVVAFHKGRDGIKNSRSKSRNIYTDFLRAQIPLIAAASFASLIIALAGICAGFTLQIIVDGILQPANDSDSNVISVLIEKISNHFASYSEEKKMSYTIAVVCGGILLIHLIQYISYYLRGVWFAIICRRFEKNINIKFIEHVIDLPYSFVQTQKAGDIINRYANISEIEGAIINLLLTVGLDSTLVIVGGVVLFLLSPKLCIVTFAIILSFAIIAICFKSKLKTVNEEIMVRNGCVMSFEKEIIDGIEAVKSTSSQQWCKNRATELSESYIESNYRENILSLKQNVISGLVMAIGLIGIVWVGATAVCEGNITLGILLTFYSLIGYFFEPIKNILDLQPMFQKAVVAAGKLDDIFAVETEDIRKDNNCACVNDIKLCNLTYTYNNGEAVINNLNVTITRGTVTGIVGRSGCGKTTLAKVIAGLLPIEKGTLRVGSDEYNEMVLTTLRSKVQYVPQFSFFFAGSIGENLTLGIDNVRNDIVEKACAESEALEFINALPFGFNTALEENAFNLSAGQRQRLAIARALLHNPEVLILDEATSNIDDVSEKKIINNMLKHKEEMTIILITHNKALLKRCDDVFVMENGTLSKVNTAVK